MNWKEYFQKNSKTKLLPFWKKQISNGNDEKNSKMLVIFSAFPDSAITLICRSYREIKNIEELLSGSPHG